MRTLIIIAGGLVLWALCLASAWFLQKLSPASVTAATLGFAAAWLAVAAFNMWFGVNRAGYSVSEEFPIFLVIFAVPAVVAFAVRWLILRAP